MYSFPHIHVTPTHTATPPLTQIRHCALSLVGEPIAYPEINALVGELHARRISTFLVNNAQLPDAIRRLKPVTQVWVWV